MKSVLGNHCIPCHLNRIRSHILMIGMLLQDTCYRRLYRQAEQNWLESRNENVEMDDGNKED